MQKDTENLKYSKLVEVNNIKSGTSQDAGYDLYLPKITTNFVSLLLERNPKLYVFSHQLINMFSGQYLSIDIKNHQNKSVFVLKNNVISLFKPIAIPSGIQLLLPEGIWAALDNRSSNFGKNFDVKLGYIDNSYTFGTAFQITPIDFDEPVNIEVETRIGQLILHKLIKPESEEIEFFDLNPKVIENRQVRLGGFGSTGNK